MKPLRLTLAALVTWGLSASAAATPPSQSPRNGVLSLRTASSPAVYLRPLDFEMGSNEEEVLAALVRCRREPLPDHCDETTFANETPPHREHVAGFWMSRTEVTVAEYGRCVAVGRCGPA